MCIRLLPLLLDTSSLSRKISLFPSSRRYYNSLEGTRNTTKILRKGRPRGRRKEKCIRKLVSAIITIQCTSQWTDWMTGWIRKPLELVILHKVTEERASETFFMDELSWKTSSRRGTLQCMGIRNVASRVANRHHRFLCNSPALLLFFCIVKI